MVDAHKIEDDLVFLNGEALGPREAVEIYEHISPISLYYKVLAALFVLTGLTYAVSYLDLGQLALPVAMFVAVVKVSLVCTYFMHLKNDDRYHVFVFLSTMLFVGIFFTFIMFDLSSRDRLNEEQGTFFQQRMDPAKGMPHKQPGFGPGLTPAPPEGAKAADKTAAPAASEANDKAADGAGAH